MLLEGNQQNSSNLFSTSDYYGYLSQPGQIRKQTLMRNLQTWDVQNSTGNGDKSIDVGNNGTTTIDSNGNVIDTSGGTSNGGSNPTPTQAPVTTQPTTQAPVTTQAPITTQAQATTTSPKTTAASVTTSAPITTKASVTTKASTTTKAATTTPAPTTTKSSSQEQVNSKSESSDNFDYLLLVYILVPIIAAIMVFLAILLICVQRKKAFRTITVSSMDTFTATKVQHFGQNSPAFNNQKNQSSRKMLASAENGPTNNISPTFDYKTGSTYNSNSTLTGNPKNQQRIAQFSQSSNRTNTTAANGGFRSNKIHPDVEKQIMEEMQYGSEIVLSSNGNISPGKVKGYW
eukprot:403365977